MAHPIIDIVIPNRNKAAFLPRTLSSLLAQTETRWRAIIIDGDSTDGSLDIFRATAREDPRFVVLTARPASLTGLSIYRSWNHGLLQVRAPFFAVLTSDDIWEPSWIRTALDALESNSGVVAVVARAIMIDERDVEGGPTVSCKQFEESFNLSGNGSVLLDSKSCTLRALLLGPIFSSIHTIVFRSKILEDGLLFAEDLGYTADLEYYLHTCMHGDIIYDMGHRALFRNYEAQESSAAKGPMISHFWRKTVVRNRRLVAEHLGIPIRELSNASEDILKRHLFMMTKPNRATYKHSKFLAALQFARAIWQSPRLALEFLRVRGDRSRFLLNPAAAMASQMSAKYGFNRN